jgi:hypothetical protein
MSEVPANIYPLSTAGEIAIPLDVARPVGMIRASPTHTSASSATLPGELNLCSVYFSEDTYLFTAGVVTPAANTLAAGVFYCKGGMISDLYLPKNIAYKGVSKDSLGYINILETWVQMNNTGTYGVS